jgi:hypothetical protein
MAQIVIDSNSNLIQGDFDSATVNNRTKFQTSTVNANTGVYAVPNGTGTVAGFQAANNSNPTDASKIVMATNGSTDTQIISGVNGTGTYLPLSFYTNNTLGMQLTTAGALNITGGLSAAAVTSLGETTTISATAATGTINYDVSTQGVVYYTTNASANWTVNFRGSSTTTLNSLMAVGETRTVTFLVTQGATAYYNSAVTVDSVSVTPKWQGGTAPTTGNASSIDTYTYSIIKTAASTYIILASQSQFK